jgi:Ser/Thr protein kinase RdoA (MazF antagonist)
VAVALGEMLAEMQTFTSDFAGDFRTKTIELEPHPGGAVHRVIDENNAMIAMADAHGIVNDDDRALLDSAAISARVSRHDLVNTYVHCDYKLNNLTVSEEKGRWRVSGLFDLHEAHFGDGTLDIVRQACSYLDTEPELAQVFIEAYRSNVDRRRIVPERISLYVLNDRMKFWAFFAQPERRADWTRDKTFREWSGRYLDAIVKLL